MSETSVYAVAGYPVLHSRSPEIFEAGFRAAGISAVYTRLAARNAEEIKLVAEALDLKGLNITSPFKETIIPFLDELTPPAREIGAVNVVIRKNGRFIGDNTDYLGAINALTAQGVDLPGRRALVIGAGGAARAAVHGLLRKGCLVTIVNRTEAKAEAIAKRMDCSWKPPEGLENAVRNSEIIVSCRSVSGRAFDPICLRRDQVILDARYQGSQWTDDAADRAGLVISGHDWLLHQAAAGFERMTGISYPVSALENALAGEAPAHPEKAIALIGFMGSGKTSLGNLLAHQLKRRHLDSDDMIESATGLTIPEIFARSGEAEFRAIEKKVIRSLDFAPDSVVSLGGGAVLNPEIRTMIKAKTLSFWIYADTGTTFNRIPAGSRPLLERMAAAGEIGALFRSRIPAYAAAADAVVVNGGRPGDLEAAAKRIEDEIRQSLRS